MYLFCFLQLLRETPPDGDKFAKTVEVCVIFHLDVVLRGWEHVKVIEDLPLNNRGGGREGKVYVILPFGEYKNWEDLVAGITYEKLGNLSLNLARVWVWFFIFANSSTSWSNKIRSPIRAKENITTNQNSKQKQANCSKRGKKWVN